jgi:thioredoxin 1
MSRVITITDAEFDTEVLQADHTVLVYFWASWCGPCRLMSPLMDGLATKYSDRLKVVKMEVDPNPQSVAAYQVEGVPAFRLFQQGQVVDSSEGAISKQKLEDLVGMHLSEGISSEQLPAKENDR